MPTSVVTGRGLDDLKVDARARAVRDAAAARHRQAAAAGRSRVHAAGHRDRGDRHAVRRHAAARPVGGDSAVGEDRPHPPDPVARPRCRGERPRHADGAEPGGCRCHRRRPSRRRRDARRTSAARASVLDVLLEISPRATRSLKDGVRVRVHHGSGNVAAHVALGVRRRSCRPARAVLAQLRLEAPAFVFAGDRFTVRDWSEQHTLAGAIVLDPDATRKAFRTPARQSVAGARGGRRSSDPRGVSSPHTSRTTARSAGRSLLLKSHFSGRRIDDAVDRPGRAKACWSRSATSSCDAATWQALTEKAAEAIDAAHRAHPEHPRRPARPTCGRALQAALPLDEHVRSADRQPVRATGSFARVVRSAARRTEPALPEPLQAAGREAGRDAGGQAARSAVAQGARARCAVAARAAVSRSRPAKSSRSTQSS